MASLVKHKGIYYLQDYVGRRLKRWSLRTKTIQIAKEKLRQYESAKVKGDSSPLPTRIRLPVILGMYVEHIRAVKTAKSAQTDIYYLRQMFGPVCPALEITSRKVGENAMKRPRKPGVDKRLKQLVIAATHLEEITTSDISMFIATQVRTRGLAPKMANRYREIACRLFNVSRWG